jgi:hypothetical protein
LPSIERSVANEDKTVGNFHWEAAMRLYVGPQHVRSLAEPWCPRRWVCTSLRSVAKLMNPHYDDLTLPKTSICLSFCIVENCHV